MGGAGSGRRKTTVVIEGDSSDLQKALGDATKASTKTSKALKEATKVATAGFIALSAVATKAVMDFSSFENEMLGVKTLLDETSFGAKSLEQGFADMKKETLDLAKQSSSSISELNKALFDTVSAGIDASKAVETLAVSNKLAIAGITSVSVATDGLTSALNAYQKGAEEANSVAAKFFTAQKFGKTTVEELANGFGLVGSSANAMGVSMEELLGAVSAVTTAGVRTNAAYTGMKAVLANIAKPTADAAKEAERLGVSFDAASLRSQGLEKFLGNLTKANGFTKDSVTKLFGSVEAQNIIFSLAGAQAKDFSRNVKELSDEQKLATTFATAFNTQNESMENTFKRLKNTSKVFSIQLGEALAPAVRFLTNEFSNMTDEMDKGGSIIDAVTSIARGAIRVVLRLKDGFQTLGTVIGASLGTALAAIAQVASGNFSQALETVKSGTDELGKDLMDITNNTNRQLKELDDSFKSDKESKQKEHNDKTVENEKTKNAKILENQQTHNDAMTEQQVQNAERDKAFKEELQALSDEEKALLNEKDLQELNSKLMTEREAEAAVAKEKVSDNIARRNQFLKDEAKFGTSVAKMKSFFAKEEVQGVKSASSQLMQLQNSRNSTMQAVGRAAARVNAAIATSEGAIKAYTSLAGIPFVGPALGIAAAGAITAFGIEQQRNIQSAQDGGEIRNLNGGSNLRDSQLSFTQPGELVTPVRNFDEVIGSTRALREAEKVGGGSIGGGGELMIGFQDEKAADVLTIQDNENESLGISRRIA